MMGTPHSVSMRMSVLGKAACSKPTPSGSDSRAAQVDPVQPYASSEVRNPGVGDLGASEAQSSQGLELRQVRQPGVGHISPSQAQLAKLMESGEHREELIGGTPPAMHLTGVIDQVGIQVDADDGPTPSLIIPRVDSSSLTNRLKRAIER